MKSTELIVLGLAGLAVYMITKSKATSTAAAGSKPSAGLSNPAEWVSQIFDSAGGQFSNGWQYFSNGTAIDPMGNYYYNGQMVWTSGAVQA